MSLGLEWLMLEDFPLLRSELPDESALVEEKRLLRRDLRRTGL